MSFKKKLTENNVLFISKLGKLNKNRINTRLIYIYI